MRRRLAVIGIVLAGCAQNRGGSAAAHPPPSPRITVVTETSGAAETTADEPAARASDLADRGAPSRPRSAGITPQGDHWLGGSLVQPRMLAGSPGETFLGLWVDTPGDAGARRAAPMDVALVVDGSGSMRGAKMAQAQRAARELVGTLRDGDRISVYVFADRAREVVAPTLLDAATRPGVLARIAGIEPRGGTDLFHGLLAATDALARAPATHTLRRVIVVSDGRANIGPTRPAALEALAARSVVAGASVSAIGIGLDYDEAVLAAISRGSAGRLHHLDDASQIAAIVREELQQLSDSVATDVTLEVTPEPGVQLLGVEGVPAELSHGRLRVRLGNLHPGRHHEVLVRVRVDTATAGDHPMASARLSYRDPGGLREEHEESLALSYDVASDASEVQSDARVLALVATHRASASQLEAVAALNRGDATGGAEALERAEHELRAAAAPSVAPTGVPVPAPAAPVVANLERQADEIHHARAALASHAPSRPALRRGALEANHGAMDVYAEY